MPNDTNSAPIDRLSQRAIDELTRNRRVGLRVAQNRRAQRFLGYFCQ